MREPARRGEESRKTVQDNEERRRISIEKSNNLHNHEQRFEVWASAWRGKESRTREFRSVQPRCFSMQTGLFGPLNNCVVPSFALVAQPSAPVQH